MSKFKAGDKVRKKKGVNKGEWDNYPYVTVRYVDDGEVWVEETGTFCYEDSLEFYNSIEEEREELLKALELVRSYKIGMYSSQSLFYYKSFDSVVPQGIVDYLLPLETPQQAKLRELEEQQRSIAEQMEQLRSQL